MGFSNSTVADLSPADVTVFTVVHILQTAVNIAATWYLCYEIPTLSKLIFGIPFVKQRMHKYEEEAARKGQESKSTTSMADRFSSWFPSLDSNKLKASFVESFILRMVLKPVTLPLKFWLNWKATKAWRRLVRRLRDKNSELEELANESVDE